MTGFALFLWDMVIYAGLALIALSVTVIWLIIAYAVIRLVAEFIKAFKETKNLDLEDPQDEEERW